MSADASATHYDGIRRASGAGRGLDLIEQAMMARGVGKVGDNRTACAQILEQLGVGIGHVEHAGRLPRQLGNKVVAIRDLERNERRVVSAAPPAT